MRVWFGRYTIIAVLTVLGWSCGSRERSAAVALMKEYVGSEVRFPEGLVYMVKGDTVVYNPGDADYTIVTWIDSAGCTPCRMKLSLWDRVINELKSAGDAEVRFIMILQSSRTDELTYALMRDNFRNAVTFDNENKFGSMNSLPKAENCHTLLLDGDNRIVAMGNPAINPKIRKLYREIISGGADETDINKDITGERTYATGVLEKGEQVSKMFILSHTGSTTLTIEEMVGSCDCITGESAKSELGAGERIEISVSMEADSTAGVFERYVDVSFKERETPVRLMLHGFKI